MTTIRDVHSDTHPLKIYLFDSEYRDLKRDVKQAGVDHMSTYIRYALDLVKASDIKHTIEESRKLNKSYHDLTVQLSKLGTNLNQIARQYNKGVGDDVELKDWVNKNGKQITKLLKELSDSNVGNND